MLRSDCCPNNSYVFCLPLPKPERRGCRLILGNGRVQLLSYLYLSFPSQPSLAFWALHQQIQTWSKLWRYSRVKEPLMLVAATTSLHLWSWVTAGMLHSLLPISLQAAEGNGGDCLLGQLLGGGMERDVWNCVSKEWWSSQDHPAQIFPKRL